MAILEIGESGIDAVPRVSLVEEGVRERGDLQRVLLAGIEAVAPDVMVITEEFGSWEGSRRRIDILGLDKDANIVVIELKRTEDGGHMELQALRYAAMASVLTFDQVIEVHSQFLSVRDREADAREAILEFLGWDDADDEQFAQDVRIVLVSVEFSKEITTTVLWLNDKGLDIRCVRLTPYKLDDRLLVDVQQIIPLPEAADYQTQVRKKQKGVSRGRDLTRFNLDLGGDKLLGLPKRRALYQAFRYLVERGVSPERVTEAIGFRGPDTVMVRFDGEVDGVFVADALEARSGPGKGDRYNPRRWFCDDDLLLRFGGKTYIVSKMWGRYTERALRNMAAAFPEFPITIEPVRDETEFLSNPD